MFASGLLWAGTIRNLQLKIFDVGGNKMSKQSTGLAAAISVLALLNSTTALAQVAGKDGAEDAGDATS